AVALLVEGLGLVEVGVDELRVVLIEAGLEHRDDPELLGDGRPHAGGAEREADGRAGDLEAIAKADAELLRERLADDHAGKLRGRAGLARIRIEEIRERV